MKHIDYEEFAKHFYYDETSPSFLRWRISKGTRKAHDIAGTPSGNGYYMVGFNRKSYLAYRIIYCIMNGGIDDTLVIDHKDRVKSNNNIWNLQAVTQAENMTNRTRQV